MTTGTAVTTNDIGEQIEETPCAQCVGVGYTPVGIITGDALDEIIDKLGDILDKCNDIFEKVSE